jgi:predicted RND superfamily exporter protein
VSDSQPSPVRDRIEAFFEAWGHFACRYAWPLIAGMLAVSAALILQVPSLETDNSTDSFLHPGDPIRVAYDDFRRRLVALHEDLDREVPNVEEMISLVNARNTRGEADELIVEDLLETWPETPAQLEALRERVLGNPLYRNTLISRDARVTTVSIEVVAFGDDAAGSDLLSGFDEEVEAEPVGDEREFLSEAELSASVRAVRAVMARHDGPGFRLHLAGAPVMTQQLNTRMQADMQRFTPSSPSGPSSSSCSVASLRSSCRCSSWCSRC